LSANDKQQRPYGGRFLPPDPRVTGPYRLTPKIALRIGLLGTLALAVFAVLFLRLWALQVLSGEQYLRAAQNNQLRTVRLEPPRGVIYDRKGRVLVGNRPGSALKLWPPDLPEKGRYQLLQRLSRIVGVPANRMAREVDERADQPLTPVTVKLDLTQAEVMYLEERAEEFPGVEIATTYLRDYPYGTAAAQALGHVGEITEEQLERRRARGLRAGDKVGQAGVEQAFDDYLRGVPGTNKLRVDSVGRPISDITPSIVPRPGNNVRLTIDAKLQLAAERALVNGIRRARESQCDGCWNANGGALVALEAKTGAVLAMASSPTYDPRVFVRRSKWKELAPLLAPRAAFEANYPGLNRVIEGIYPPGSTFKPVTAIAALEEHLVLPYQSLPCTGVFIYHGEDGKDYPFANWDPYVNTAITMPDAISRSCDTYFYELGMRFYRLKSSPLQKWASEFGFGRRTGIEIGPEATGLVPTPGWRKRTFKTALDRLWKAGDSIQLTIGQKDMVATPLQMARFYAMVANGGRLVTPHLLLDVEGPGGLPIVPRPAPPAPRRIDVSPSALAVVRRGLWEATHLGNGTSTAAFWGFPVEIAGKTGTAEKVSIRFQRSFDQAWWCGYGPADDPEIVVCALVENGGHGGSTAAPVAREVLAEWFGVQEQGIGPLSSSETD
jgi:penicillin-binding protein 2